MHLLRAFFWLSSLTEVKTPTNAPPITSGSLPEDLCLKPNRLHSRVSLSPCSSENEITKFVSLSLTLWTSTFEALLQYPKWTGYLHMPSTLWQTLTALHKFLFQPLAYPNLASKPKVIELNLLGGFQGDRRGYPDSTSWRLLPHIAP